MGNFNSLPTPVLKNTFWLYPPPYPCASILFSNYDAWKEVQKCKANSPIKIKACIDLINWFELICYSFIFISLIQGIYCLEYVFYCLIINIFISTFFKSVRRPLLWPPPHPCTQTTLLMVLPTQPLWMAPKAFLRGPCFILCYDDYYPKFVKVFKQLLNNF